MAGIINKLKDAVSGGSTAETGNNTTHNTTSGYSNTSGSNTYGSNTGNAPHTQGPHSTDAANRADPRVDSDGNGRAGYETGSNYEGSRGTTGTMGSGVGHPDTGVGKNTTSTPIFGSKDNHLGHSERDDLSNYEARHGQTQGLSHLQGNAGQESAYHQGSTGTSGLGAAAGALGSSAHTSSSGVGYGQNTSGYGSSTTGTGLGSTGTSTTSGPHNSSLLNKLDPRVDSDRDGSRTAGTTGSGLTGSTGNYSTSGDAGYPHQHVGLHAAEVISELKGGESVINPVHHSHNLYMSDKIEDYEAGSGRHTVGDPDYHLRQNQAGSGLTGGTTGQTGYGNTNTAGPHNSNIANKLDPRVDSDRDGSRTTGQGYGNTGMTGGQGYGNTGSGLTGSTGQTGYGNTTGTGLTGSTGQTGYGNTTSSGPHNSNVLNKADPRVDSDRDGSRLH